MLVRKNFLVIILITITYLVSKWSVSHCVGKFKLEKKVRNMFCYYPIYSLSIKVKSCYKVETSRNTVFGRTILARDVN